MPISQQPRRARWLAAAVAVLTVLAHTPAGAAPQCTDGPASAASRDVPHLVDAAASDPAGENLPSPTGVSEVSDIRSAWVSAVVRPDETLDFSLHVNLARLPDTRGSYVHVNVVGDGTDNYLAYLSQEALDVPSWRTVRSWTELDMGSAGGRTILNVVGDAAGALGTDGVVTFDIPDGELEGLTAVRLEVETGTLEPGPAKPGQLHGLLRHDAAGPSCTVVLA